MTDAPPTWDPRQYDRFQAERDRPALDLLARIPADLALREIWDLGCGPGRQAAWLKQRHPEATVHGLDSSEAMLAEGRASPEDIDWRLGDIAGWTPERPADLIFANASLQWVPDHAAMFPRLMRALGSGGVLAVQMPWAWESPQHQAIRAVAAAGPWAEALAGVAAIRALLEPEAYYDLLSREGGEVDIWTTTYIHVLSGEDPVLEWVKGTALRPYLDALPDPVMRQGFLEALGRRLRDVFPRRSDGVTLLPFPRLFLVARATASGGGAGR